MDTCTISRKQKTSLVKPKFSETRNTIPWHKKKQNKSSERKDFNFDQAKIFMKDEVRMQLVRCTERNKSPSSDGMTGLWGTRRDLACLAFYCCRHNITTVSWGGKGLFILQFTAHHQGKPNRNSRRMGTWNWGQKQRA